MSALDDLLMKQYQEDAASETRPEEPSLTTGVSEDNEVAEANAESLAGEGSINDHVGSHVDTDDMTVEVADQATERETEHETDSVTEDVAADSVEDVAETFPTEPPVRVFKPDWEVDRFLWPGICGEVEDRLEEALESAVETIQADCEQQQCNVIALMSAGRSAGSTTMTLCLAREAARQGLKVAMIDLNHRAPSLMNELGVACEVGIESLQRNGVTSEAICVTAIQDGVSLLPMLEAVEVEHCVSETVQSMLEVIAQNHDLVIIDASPEVVQRMSQRDLCHGFGAVVVGSQLIEYDSAAIVRDVSGGDVWALGVIENFAA